jgi:hypothetical protein
MICRDSLKFFHLCARILQALRKPGENVPVRCRLCQMLHYLYLSSDVKLNDIFMDM